MLIGACAGWEGKGREGARRAAKGGGKERGGVGGRRVQEDPCYSVGMGYGKKNWKLGIG